MDRKPGDDHRESLFEEGSKPIGLTFAGDPEATFARGELECTE